MGILMWVGRDFEIITTWTLSYNVKQLRTYIVDITWPILGHTRPYLAILDHTWPYLDEYGQVWPCMVKYGQYLAIPAHTCPYLVIPDLTWPILFHS